MSTTMNEQSMMEMVNNAIKDMEITANAFLFTAGERLGFYRTLEEEGGLSADALAQLAQAPVAYVREWLNNQSASGYISHDDLTGDYYLSAEQSALFVDENSPVYMMDHVEKNLFPVDTQREHDGSETLPEHDTLVEEWLPALENVAAKLSAGAHVAEINCRCGAATLAMAQAFPRSTFMGFSTCEAMVEDARAEAKVRRLPNVQFQVAGEREFTGGEFDLVTALNCLSDSDDGVGTMSYIRTVLKKNGTVLIAEPLPCKAPIKKRPRIVESNEAAVHTPSTIARGIEARLRATVFHGGFTRVRQVAGTRQTILLEAKI
jgi:cyclopropane fatty-acyl-phospholipid synthase-like methyltransferase